MTVKDFIDSCLNPENNKPYYLAQHNLFNQIPELKNEIL